MGHITRNSAAKNSPQTVQQDWEYVTYGLARERMHTVQQDKEYSYHIWFNKTWNTPHTAQQNSHDTVQQDKEFITHS